MKASFSRVFLFCLVLFGLSACSLLSKNHKTDSAKYLSAGTIIISHQVPDKNPLAISEAEEGKLYAPLIGYFPPAITYLPADNETWLEVNSQLKKLTLYKGKTPIKEMEAEGSVSLSAGDYYLQHKQKQPLWYAPNEYFSSRQLTVPSPNDRLRYRRGALGKYALFPTTAFPIHCAPLWSEDVGGMRVSSNDLASIYYMLPIGAPIVVK